MTRPTSPKKSRLVKPLSIAISSCILAACSSAPTSSTQPTSTKMVQGNSAKTANTAYTGVLDPQMLDALEDLLQATDMSMVEGDELAVSRYGNLWERIRRGYRMPDRSNARIEAQKSWFYSRQSYLDRLTARASRYLHHTVAEAERRGIPSELALLPIIESSYDPTATSNAAAAGLWQFIPSTGRIYGLNQSSSYDGRRDVIESTRAAYDFLTSLYNQFGSWELALAAYNAGPGRISRAIKANQEQGLPTDYWSLKLPTETMNYVPRFLAVAQIVKEPNSYGVSLPAIANHNHFRTVPVNYGVSLAEVSSVTGIGVDELRLLNPALLSQTVDEMGPNRIVIPDSVPSSTDAKLSALKGFGFGGDYVATAPAQSIDFVVPKSGNTKANTQSQQELILANTLPTTIAKVTANNTIVQEPALSKAERDFIAEQIKTETKNTVQPVSPADGNIQLDAIQTGQSVLDARGETKTIRFAGSPAAKPAPTPTPLPPAQSITQPAQVAAEQPVLGQSTVIAADDDVPPSVVDDGMDGFSPSVQTQNTQPSAPSRPEPVQAAAPAPKPTATAPKPTPKPAAKPESYTVRAGDSLTSVAAANGLTVGQLASFNNLPVDSGILIGQKLWLVAGKVKPQAVPTKPAAAPSTTASNASSNNNPATHKVVAGEGLTVIARKYNVSLQALAAENGLSVTDNVLIGQVLKLPNGAAAPVQTAKAAAPKVENKTESKAESKAENKPESYTVRAGDSLTSVAAANGLTVGQLASFNNLPVDSGILIGQKLWLVAGKVKPQAVPTKPAAAPSTTASNASSNNNPATHKVVAGEGLTVIARKYNVSLQALAAENGLSVTDNVLIGQVLKLPNGAAAPVQPAKTTPAPTPKAASNNTSTAATDSYTVKAGESLTALASRFGVSIQELASANNLATNANLLVGQRLRVPKTTTTYTVKAGDGLISLARRYGISAQELAKMNNIEPTANLQIGQVLTVPNK
ncbi:LysM peptidoglycan-binding domain-containing protein [Moraxella sp. FZFQ2102]|uniref:LysM peptidoglycan-binding domain-containing protein n=1 Tax=Moraxella sp. FZFQ2102 TaxID=2953752 RepID=UPI00209C46B5|nr:LysM peptidoglycan-binding domain-containing protein [Moraxella sp. FZFQ2102]USZ14801.1 LysM peptidoglycan-binding domain-containing protein [Moraxella sp. FZFQ2102]